MMRYQTPEDAAGNVCVLLEYLRAAESSGSYVYRGQLHDWDGPLLPSIYRRCIPLHRTYTSEADEYRHCLRRCGTFFIEVKPDSYVDRIILDHKDHDIAPDEHAAMVALARDPHFSLLVATSGFEAAIRARVLPNRVAHVLSRLGLWKQIIDEIQKGFIRHIGFLQPFGYMLGMTLAQQYGFASELLDFTSDLRVAAFFATHDYPRYQFESAADIFRRLGSRIGVIHRLPSTEGNVRYARVDSFGYYGCPNQLHLRDLCMRFEDKSSPELHVSLAESMDLEDFQHMASSTAPSLQWLQRERAMEGAAQHELSLAERVDKYLYLYFYSNGARYFRLLDMPPGSFAQSRLGRQSAVMVVPDELRLEDAEDHSATFQAIEDLKRRPGFESFYFAHSDSPQDLGGVDREQLWPKENDVFKTLASRVLLPSTMVYGWEDVTLPKRIDLVSEGYEDLGTEHATAPRP